MVNPFKCGRCKVFFDSDIQLLNRDGPNHLPVSCMSCPYTICHACYTDWLVDGKEGDIVCPDCESANGFNAELPNVSPFACQLLAARAATAGAIVVPEQSVASVALPSKKPKQRASGGYMKPAAAPRARPNPAKQTRAKAVTEGAELAVTDEELEALENHDIVSGMNEWLKRVVKVSNTNQRNVMKKVAMLCAGDGLSVSTWPDGISFMKGSPVNLSMDFDDMLNEADEGLKKHGRDPGNGWALKHPLTYLGKYQKYVVKEKFRDPVGPSEQSAFASTPPKPKKQQQNHSESEEEPILTPSVKPAARKQKHTKPQSEELEVTEEELVALENHEVASGMREWLDKVVKATATTQKKILAKSEKLCEGAGLRISTWPADISFMKGYEVNLSMDFNDMLREARAQEAKHGQDPGSGWAIRRPLTYLRNYQRYVLEEKLRKVQPAVVTPSPKENKRKQDDSFNPPEPVASAPPTKPAAKKKQKLAKPTSEEIEVSEEELEALENRDVESGMSEWLDNVAKVSQNNKRNIMLKVGKLCGGEGIQVHGWPADVFFMKGYKVNLSMDFDDMLKEEKAYETKYGKDKSNGWGLRHPISNLRKYQKYVLEEKIRK